MFEIVVEVLTYCWETVDFYQPPQPKQPEHQIIDFTALCVLGFCLGCAAGLIYCEYLATLPPHIEPPLTSFYQALAAEFASFKQPK